jgi:hypothetical protein
MPVPTLTDYQTEVLELLHDPNNTYYSVTDINNYINRARHRIATKSQCVRVLLSGGTITGLSINSGGSGYSGTPTVTISGAGQQASATATILAGAINTVTLTNNGWGYITGTTTTVFASGSGGGSNATFNLTIDQSLTTVPGQEVYPFANATSLVTNAGFLFPGIEDVVGVLSVACAWGANAAMKPMLRPKIWSEFQAYLRSYNTGMRTYPAVWSQYGTGVGTGGGSIYLWPLPSQPSQMDWDCWCRPVPLVQGAMPATPEAIPYQFTTAVAFYAAYLAYSNAQRAEDAKNMFEQYNDKVVEAQAAMTAPFVDDYYESDF